MSAVLPLLRRHRWLLPVLVLGVLARVLMTVAYPHAFFFPDSRSYVLGAATNTPDPARPWGYSLLLKPFVSAYAEYLPVALLQHLAGLALIVGGYAFLTRRGVPGWGAALAMLPVAVDARELTLEHYVLAETAFVALTAAGLILLSAAARRSGLLLPSLAGLLLAAAALTRTVGLPVIALAGLYLLLRRVGWARLAAFALPVLLLLGGYLAWYHRSHGVYAFGQYQGRFLYGRVMSFADCPTLKLTAEQRRLCLPSAPATWKQKPDQFIWNKKSPARKYFPDPSSDPVFSGFAKSVIRQQPGDYAYTIAEGTLWHLLPHAPLDDFAECLSAGRWLPPADPGAPCQPTFYLPTAAPELTTPVTVADPTPLRKSLHAYGGFVTTPGLLYALAVLTCAYAIFRRRVDLDGLLFVATGFGLLVISVATSIFDYRYAVPAVLLIPLGLALTIRCLCLGPTVRRIRPGRDRSPHLSSPDRSPHRPGPNRSPHRFGRDRSPLGLAATVRRIGLALTIRRICEEPPREPDSDAPSGSDGPAALPERGGNLGDLRPQGQDVSG